MKNIEIIGMDDFQKQRIGIVCLPGLESFLPAIVKHLEKTYTVKTCYNRTISEIEAVVEWADIVWIEWCNELAIEMTNKMPVLAEKKVIIRLHSYEAFSNYVQAAKWSMIDSVIFVAAHIRDIVLKSIPRLSELVDIHVVHNGV